MPGDRRSLHWERGLKRTGTLGRTLGSGSLPSLGAWIETSPSTNHLTRLVSLPSLGAWIETQKPNSSESVTAGRSLHWERGLKHIADIWDALTTESLPSLGAWIETGQLA